MKIILFFILICTKAITQNSITHDTVMQNFYTVFDTNMPTQIKSIKDFGAIGDGITDDTWAFYKAGNYLSNLNNTNYICKLVIPEGTYRVGKQIKWGTSIIDPFGVVLSNASGTKFAYKYIDVFTIINGKNLIIEGDENSQILYNDSLYYGSWDAQLDVPKYLPLPNYNFSLNAHLGIFLLLRNTKNVVLKNIKVNGNLKAFKVGGNWGDSGYQNGSIALQVRGSSENVLIKNFSATYFGQDAIYIGVDTLSNKRIIIDKGILNYNGRQGLSWGGGSGLYVFNTQFNKTAKGGLANSPGAGLDIEPEQAEHTCQNGYFENSEFIDNGYTGLISYNPTATAIIRNIKFNNCTFWGVTRFSLIISNAGLSFKNCKIYGGTSSLNGLSNANKLYFKNCIFEDKSYTKTSNIELSSQNVSNHLNIKNNVFGGFLIEGGSHKFLEIDSCKLIANFVRPTWIIGDSTTLISNTNIIIKIPLDRLGYNPNSTYISLISGAKLKNLKIYDEIAVPNYSSVIPKYCISMGSIINLGGNEIINCNYIKWFCPWQQTPTCPNLP